MRVTTDKPVRRKIRNKYLRRLVPFNGTVAWEVQVGPLVIMRAHKGQNLNPRNEKWFTRTLVMGKNHSEIRLGRWCLWTDPFWTV